MHTLKWRSIFFSLSYLSTTTARPTLPSLIPRRDHLECGRDGYGCHMVHTCDNIQNQEAGVVIAPRDSSNQARSLPSPQKPVHELRPEPYLQLLSPQNRNRKRDFGLPHPDVFCVPDSNIYVDITFTDGASAGARSHIGDLVHEAINELDAFLASGIANASTVEMGQFDVHQPAPDTVPVALVPSTGEVGVKLSESAAPAGALAAEGQKNDPTDPINNGNNNLLFHLMPDKQSDRLDVYEGSAGGLTYHTLNLALKLIRDWGEGVEEGAEVGMDVMTASGSGPGGVLLPVVPGPGSVAADENAGNGAAAAGSNKKWNAHGWGYLDVQIYEGQGTQRGRIKVN